MNRHSSSQLAEPQRPWARLLIVAHAPLASALREVGMHVLPDAAQWVCTMDVPAHEAPELTLARALAAMRSELDPHLAEFPNSTNPNESPTSAQNDFRTSRPQKAPGDASVPVGQFEPLGACELEPTAAPEPVLVLCDVPGATPANVAARLVEAINERARVRCAQRLTGANVPMLLRALTYWPSRPEQAADPSDVEAIAQEWAERALEGGRRALQAG